MTVEQILHVFEILSIVGGALLVAYRFGVFSQTIRDANENFAEKMQESKLDREQIHLELKQIANILSDNKVFEHRLEQLEKWYDELRRGIGIIKEGH